MHENQSHIVGVPVIHPSPSLPTGRHDINPRHRLSSYVIQNDGVQPHTAWGTNDGAPFNFHKSMSGGGEGVLSGGVKGSPVPFLRITSSSIRPECSHSCVGRVSP